MDRQIEAVRSVTLGLRRLAQDMLCDPHRHLRRDLEAATACWRRRHDRREHPAGTFDRQSRWYPGDSERQTCCDSVRGPSRAWPYSYMLHCRSVEHVAALYGVDPTMLRRATRQAALDIDALLRRRVIEETREVYHAA